MVVSIFGGGTEESRSCSGRYYYLSRNPGFVVCLNLSENFRIKDSAGDNIIYFLFVAGKAFYLVKAAENLKAY